MATDGYSNLSPLEKAKVLDMEREIDRLNAPQKTYMPLFTPEQKAVIDDLTEAYKRLNAADYDSLSLIGKISHKIRLFLVDRKTSRFIKKGF